MLGIIAKKRIWNIGEHRSIEQIFLLIWVKMANVLFLLSDLWKPLSDILFEN